MVLTPLAVILPALAGLAPAQSSTQPQAQPESPPSAESSPVTLPPVTLPPGTPLPLALTAAAPMRVGEPLRAELLYPVYLQNHVVLPARTTVTGTVVSLAPDRRRRIDGRLHVDFTPYHTPVVRFDSILAPNGAATPITTTPATDGAPIYSVLRTPKPQGGFFGQYFRQALQYADDSIQAVIGPGKADRFRQFLYNQLPWHPERIPAETAWTVETAAPLAIAPLPPPPPVPAPAPSRFRLLHTRTLPTDAPANPAGERPTWTLKSYLDQDISSETSATAQPIRATVAEPVLNPDGSVAIPQGSVLSGTVTQARPARHFARSGVLRFSFSQLTLPDQQPQTVRTTLASADSASRQQLDMNAEGEVKPKAQDKILIPALLVLLASQPLDHDGGAQHHAVGKNAVASASLGLITLVVGTAARQPNLAAGIGFYSAALAIYPRYFAKGSKVAFPKDTRIVLQTTATRTPALKPAP